MVHVLDFRFELKVLFFFLLSCLPNRFTVIEILELGTGSPDKVWATRLLTVCCNEHRHLCLLHSFEKTLDSAHAIRV